MIVESRETLEEAYIVKPLVAMDGSRIRIYERWDGPAPAREMCYHFMLEQIIRSDELVQRRHDPEKPERTDTE
jgi:hypothetical protein